MIELKTLSAKAIPAALAKAQRYRMLNDPDEAESICLDILAVEPDNQDALITMLLAVTDKFSYDLTSSFQKAREIVHRLGATNTAHFTTTASSLNAGPKSISSRADPDPGRWPTAGSPKPSTPTARPSATATPTTRTPSCAGTRAPVSSTTMPRSKPEGPETGEMLLDSFDTPPLNKSPGWRSNRNRHPQRRGRGACEPIEVLRRLTCGADTR